MLNRPFIYNNDNLQNQLIRQNLNLRYNLKKRFPSLANKDELDQVLDKTGKIVKISELETLNKEMENKIGNSLVRNVQRRIALGAIRDLD